jgi:trehalose/maltose hydrolase-like predicted phosphorylase
VTSVFAQAVTTEVGVRRRFEACVADWDGTLVPNRTSDASRVRDVVEGLCVAGFDVVVITGTHVENVDGQLRARPSGPGRLLLCVNRGSEVFECGPSGPTLLERREATLEENEQLDRAAALTVERLHDHGLEATIVAQRLNRRKVDIIPLPEWSDPPKARIADLVAAVEARLQAAGIASVAEVVTIAKAASTDAGLPKARISSDAKYVEIGLTDKADAARWTFADLWEHGISAADVLIAGDEFGELGGVPGSDSLILVPESTGALAFTVGAEPFGAPPGVLALPGGPDRAIEVLEDQLKRRRLAQPPQPRPAAGWCVTVEGFDEERERQRASVLTVADGSIGTIGVPLLSHPAVAAETLVAGFFDGEGSAEHLRPLPGWNQVATPLAASARLSRTLDLRTGVLMQDVEQAGDHVSAVAFSALHDPGTAVLWVAGAPALLRPADGGTTDTLVTTAQSGGVAVHVGDVLRGDGDQAVLERIAVFAAGDALAARSRADAARAHGVNTVHRDHREAWATRWRDADILVTGDDELQRNVRFSLFQLMGAVATRGEAALGARGLSGDGYNGHVFWDSDVFVVPFLAATCPAAAKAMLEYRVQRIGTAVERARELGHKGAKFPWESASTGREITPATVVGPRGETVIVRNGEMEDHIVADVAWAACRYDAWTGDESFRKGPLTRVLIETARYWASRIDRDGDGSAHIRHVIGPDEYHEDVDDNAFTNVMARWNLRAAMTRVGAQCDEREVHTWGTLADHLVDGLNQQTLVYEEFTGFSQLTPFPLRETYGPGPLAADSLLGFDRIKTLQVVKQADALMLHLMVPGEVPQGSLGPNLDRYLPITAHGSSLSPAVHAALLARVSRHEEALELLRFAAGMDVNGVSATTAHGLHVATMGGVWLAMVEGYAGIQPDGDGLRVQPRLPAAWQDVTVHLVYQGVRVQIHIHGDDVTVDTDRPLTVVVARD